jgi:hypothetical protein
VLCLFLKNEPMGNIGMKSIRTVVWFSCGAASAVAGKLALDKYPDTIFACCVLSSEHSDNERFLVDCEKWYGKEILRLKSPKYTDIYDVFRKTRYLVGVRGARCTTELKKKVRQDFQKLSDRQVFGFTIEEKDRAERFTEQNPEVDLYAPLIEQGYTKKDCFRELEKAGIELPMMYKLGYKNNNCIGCVKGGAGYWNKIRRDFPDVFSKMAVLERELKRTITKHKGKRVYLDELPENVGRYESELDFQCGVLCGDGKSNG